MKTVIEMAREAGFKMGTAWYATTKTLERFAALVREDERDKTLKILDDLFKHDRKESGYDEGWNDALGVAENLIEPEIAPDGRIAKTVFTLEDIQKASDMGRAAGALEMRDAAVRVVHRFISGDGLAEPFMSDIAEAIAALPILGEEK